MIVVLYRVISDKIYGGNRMDELIKYMISKIGYTLTAIIGGALPGSLLILYGIENYIWNWICLN